MLHILLICFSSFSYESHVIPNNFSPRLDAIDVLPERITFVCFYSNQNIF